VVNHNPSAMSGGSLLLTDDRVTSSQQAKQNRSQ